MNELFDPFGKDPAVIDKTSTALAALTERYFRVAVEGAVDDVPAGPVIFVANHSGALPYDALVLFSVLLKHTGREVRPLVEDAIITTPFLGTFMSRLGAVRASQENATFLLERGEAIVVFPEGMQGLGKPLRRRHQLQRFGRGGFVRLAVRTGAPLVPTAIIGGEEASPLLGKLEALRVLLPEKAPWLPITPVVPLPARFRVRVGERIDARKDVKDDSDAIAVNALAASVRDRVQKDIDELVATRGSAWL